MGNIKDKMRLKKKAQPDISEAVDSMEKGLDIVHEFNKDLKVRNALVSQLDKNSAPVKKDGEIDDSEKETFNNEEKICLDEHSDDTVEITDTIVGDNEAFDKINAREYFELVEKIKLTKILLKKIAATKSSKKNDGECCSVQNFRTRSEKPTGYGKIRTCGLGDTLYGYWREIDLQTKTMTHTNIKFSFSGTNWVKEEEKLEMYIADALNLKGDEVLDHPLTIMMKKVRRESIKSKETNDADKDSFKQNYDNVETFKLVQNKNSENHGQDYTDLELTDSQDDTGKHVADRFGVARVNFTNGKTGHYIGRLANGLPHGKGRMIYKSGKSAGNTYYGNWIDGKIKGDGRLWNKDMTVMFNGKWMNNKAKGTVTYWKGFQVYTGDIVYLNGCIYRNGSGILVFPSGKTISGRWFLGHLVGKFCCFYESGELSEYVFVPTEKANLRIPRGYSLKYDQYLDRFTSVNTSFCEQTLIKFNDLLFDLDECFSKE